MTNSRLGYWLVRTSTLAALLGLPAAALAGRGDPPPPLLLEEPPPPPVTAAAATGGPSAPPPILSPAEGATTGSDRPRIEARFAAPVVPEQVVLILDAADVTGLAEVVGTTIAFQPPRPLLPGPHQVRLMVNGVTTSWQFTFQPGASSATGASGGPRREWTVSALGSVMHQQGDGIADDTTARLRLNSRADLAGEHWYLREVTDLAMRQGLQGTTGFALESRNYVGTAGIKGAGLGAELQAGYFVPWFLDQSRLLAVGLPGGGAELHLTAPHAQLGAWATYDGRPAGVVAGTVGPDQHLRAAGAQVDMLERRYSLRVVALQSQDDPGLNSVGGEGLVFGLLARAAIAPWATVLLEAARGQYTPHFGGPDVERSGLAFRLGLLGAVSRWSWSLDLRRTDVGYVNPANRGFASGAASDRSGGDLTVSRQLGMTTIGASAHHLQGGTSAGGSTPGAREDGGNLFVTSSLGRALTLSATGQATRSTADADLAHLVPATDNLALGGSLMATERWRRLQFFESLSLQQARNHLDKTTSTTTSAVLGASGNLTDWLLLGLNGSATSAELPAPAGHATTLTAAFQPTVLLPALRLTVQPRVAWTSSDAGGVRSETLNGQLMANWNPTWLRNLFALQASVDYGHSTGSTLPVPTDVVRFMAGLVVNWTASSATPPPGSPPPGSPPLDSPPVDSPPALPPHP
jgi:hypothetical protein